MVKKKENNLSLKAALGALGALVLSVLLLVLGNSLFPFSKAEGMMGFMRAYAPLMSGVSLIALGLSMYLMFIYFKDYLKLKSSFTLGILTAIFSLMLFAVTSSPLLHGFLHVSGRGGLFGLIPMVFATLALAILAWVSSK